jgi:hypothetical protein
MALKDLVASRAKLQEADIEQIVAPYVIYDEDHKVVAFTPAGTALPARKKLLIYLVALQGWPFIASDVPTDAAPSEIVDELGLPGGTVRPMLMGLRDQNLIASRDGRYSVRASNLHSIKTELSSLASAKQSPSPRAKPSRKVKNDGQKAATTKGRKRASAIKTGSQSAKFDGWIDAGYFDQPRTLADITKKFRQAGVMVAVTSIPQLFLKAVRSERLTREEAEVEGKRVWVYSRPK